jgi:hypothetical protein
MALFSFSVAFMEGNTACKAPVSTRLDMEKKDTIDTKR